MMQNHNQQKKIALINDFTGFGRCSIAVQMPIISMLKVQCCAVPTSIFSNHTAYEDYYFTDYTSNMEAYIEQWKKLDLKFEGICTGFLGSAEQIRIVSEFIQYFRDENTVAVIDPVMGDNGEAYSTYTLPKNIAALKRDLGKYRIDYDVWFHESTLHESGAVLAVVDKLLELGACYKADAMAVKASRL